MLIFANRFLGLHALEYLIDRNHTIDHVILYEKADTDIETLAKEHNISCEYYYEGIQHKLAGEYSGEWLMSFWSAAIITPSLLKCYRKTLNIHPSLVPINQGNDCAAWTIRKGTLAGASLMEITESLDSGGVYYTKELHYEFPITGKELYRKLLDLCITIFREKWPEIYDGRITPVPQQGPRSHHTRKMTNEDRIKLAPETLSLSEFIDWSLAHDFYPRSTAEVTRDNKRYRLRVLIEEIKS